MCLMSTLCQYLTVNVKVLASKEKLIITTSQASLAKWRTILNKDKGGDYKHNMSRVVCNIAGVL